ncbi:M57 family metalloprotease [Plesiocystis pacifica]|nr:M57 family metalloprotease [Plesiocystis pacifica]
MAIVSLAFACSSEPDTGEAELLAELEAEEIVENLMVAGFPAEEIEVREDEVIVGGDAVVTLQASREMAGARQVAPLFEDEEEAFRQYRTNNLVNSPKTISVIGYTGGGNALDSTMQTALQMAVQNYNEMNLGLTFTLTTGTNYQDKDIVVYKVSGNGGGQAGFPENGNPYKFVQIQSGTSNFGTDVVEHVITHEIGHCVGFRHTDYFNRSISCGSGGNEGSSGVGAQHIPGTPTGADMSSIMLACFNSGVSGEFSSYDRTALEYLYPGSGSPDPDPGEPAPGCTGYCGGYSQSGACYCDSVCESYGDCCDDKAAVCD